MKTLKCCALMGVVLLCAITCQAVLISGEVHIVTEIPTAQLMAEYEQAKEAALWVSERRIGQRYFAQGFLSRECGSNIVVQVRRIGDGKLIATGRSDGRGRLEIELPESSWDLCVTAIAERTFDGRKVRYEGASIIDSQNNFCHLELRNVQVSLVGRCLNREKKPLARKVVRIEQYPNSENRSFQIMFLRYAETDTNGHWKCEQLISPPNIRSIEMMMNTNELDRCGLDGLPMSVSIDVCDDYMDEPKMSIEQLLVTEEMRRSAERFTATYERKTGKPYPRKAPMTIFPVSTNNVIYVPDIILP